MRQKQIHPDKKYQLQHEVTDIVCKAIDEDLTFNWMIGITQAGHFFPIANVSGTDSWARRDTETRLKQLGFTII